jgi:uncharacterized protein (DUF433 family)
MLADGVSQCARSNSIPAKEGHMSSKREALLTTPAYPFVEAAHYLHIPVTTLRAWCLGQRGFRPVIRLDGKRSEGLSFLNMIEAHILSAIRREHRIPLPKVREALRYVSKRLDMDRPLAQAQFVTQGVDLFVEVLDRILNVSKGGQVEIAELIRVHLQRIERDTSGVPIRLYPFTRKQADKEAIKSVVMDPRIAFGRPVLVGTAVPTSVLADRFKAGDTLIDLAKDYGAQPEAIEEAIRCEFDRQAA